MCVYVYIYMSCLYKAYLFAITLIAIATIVYCCLMLSYIYSIYKHWVYFLCILIEGLQFVFRNILAKTIINEIQTSKNCLYVVGNRVGYREKVILDFLLESLLLCIDIFIIFACFSLCTFKPTSRVFFPLSLRASIFHRS